MSLPLSQPEFGGAAGPLRGALSAEAATTAATAAATAATTQYADADPASAVLRRRAQALARPAQAAAGAEATLDLLEFGIGNERYALPMDGIDEVLAFERLTPLPCTPAFVLGIVNVRGRMVAVIDIRRFFDLPERGITDLHQVILVHGNGVEVGLLADAVIGLRTVAQGSLQGGLPTLHGIRADYLRGVTPDSLVVLDLDRLLADPAIVVDDPD